MRTREILWQEGHTMHETEQDARAETLRMFNIYKNFMRSSNSSLPPCVTQATSGANPST